MDVSFKFSIGDSVVIVATGITGTVRGNYIDRDSKLSAFVSYADSNKQLHDQYFREEDLSSSEATA
jgi:hypothetical protein